MHYRLQSALFRNGLEERVPKELASRCRVLNQRRATDDPCVPERAKSRPRLFEKFRSAIDCARSEDQARHR